MEIALTAISAALQALLAYWGFKLSTGPLESQRQHEMYKRGFIIVGAIGIGITIVQGFTNQQEKNQLNASIERLNSGVDKVGEQTKQPPNITVNVPPAQVITSAQRMPIPTPVRLTASGFSTDRRSFTKGFNDQTWFDVNGYPVRIDWSELEGVDVFAEVSLWSTECYTAQVRLLDLATDSTAVEGPKAGFKKTVKDGDFHNECKPIPQRFKLPRSKGARRYVLQVRSFGNGDATAVGELVFERQR